MKIRDGFVDSVGNTPLIKLRKASEQTGCAILGKAEFLNPGGSVKDRAAKYIVLDAEQRGAIEPGGLIVEGTAGNTGIGLALVGKRSGIPDVDPDAGFSDPGEKGRVKALRRRTSGSPGRTLSESQQLCARRGAHGRRTHRDGTAWRPLRESVGQHGEPGGPSRQHRTGNMGTDGWLNRTHSFARWEPEARWRGLANT